MSFVEGLAHVSLAVPDLELACAQLARTLGIAPSPPQTNVAQGVRLAYFDLGNAKIELIAPADPQAPLHAFLARNPRGALHHVCLRVQDVAQSVDDVQRSGGRVPGGIGSNVHGDPIAFVHPASTGGLLIELEGEAALMPLPLSGGGI